MRESPVRETASQEAPGSQRLLVLVEEKFDWHVSVALLCRANFPVDELSWVVAGGTEAMRKMLAETSEYTPHNMRCVAIVDEECTAVPDAVEHSRGELGFPPIPVFPAVPNIEAWLLADADAVGRALKMADAKGLIDNLFDAQAPGLDQRVERSIEHALLIVNQMDVALASTRSPSLHAFLRGMGELMNVDTSFLDQAQARGLARETLSNLLAEVVPGNAVVYRTIDEYQITASEMILQVDSGTDLGRQFASDLLRISRDFLARKARRESRA